MGQEGGWIGNRKDGLAAETSAEFKPPSRSQFVFIGQCGFALVISLNIGQSRPTGLAWAYCGVREQMIPHPKKALEVETFL